MTGRRVTGRAALADRIVQIRTRLGLAQGAFATRVGVTRNVVIRWERGHHRPSVGALERVAAAGGVTVDWLLRGDGGLAATRRDQAFEDAVTLLRTAWRDPSRRALVLRTLRALTAASPSQAPRDPS